MKKTKKLDSVFIWTEPDTLTEHTELPSRYLSQVKTSCGIEWASLPDTHSIRADGSTYVDYGDKPWYSDHDREDVIKCNNCFSQEQQT